MSNKMAVVVNTNGHHYLDPHGGGGGSPRQGVPGAVGHDDAGDGGHICVLGERFPTIRN